MIGEPANTCRKPASSSAARSASLGCAVRARPVTRLARRHGELVPGAHGEAVVAAVDAVAHRGRRSSGIGPPVLDGEVRDAAPRVEPVGRRKGRGRAGVEAGACTSRSAPPPARRAARSTVVRIAPRNTQLPKARDEQVGVLALPAEAGGLRERLLHHGGRVDEDLAPGPGASARSQRSSRFSRGLTGVVVVLAPGRRR